MGPLLKLLTQLGVDESFYVMFALFGITYLVVSSLLTRPVSVLLIERDKRILGRREEVSKIRTEFLNIAEKLAVERRGAQSAASSKFAELKNSAAIDQRKILAEARDDFAAQVKTARDHVDKMLQTERQKIGGLSDELKNQFLAKILKAGN